MSSRFFLSLLSAVFLSLPFHSPVLFPLAWVAFVPLFSILENAKGWGGAVFYGWFTGWIANLLGFYWLVYTISVFGGFSYPVSVFIFLLFASLEALQFAVFALLVHRFGFGPLTALPAFYWVALEFWFPHLFPWYLANTQSSFLPFIQSADLIGPFGTSFLLMWMSAVVYGVCFSSTRVSRGPRLVGVGALGVLIAAALIYGHLRLVAVNADMRAAPRVSLAAVQGNIDIELKWNPDKSRSNLNAHRKLSEKARDVNLVIWPETAVEEWIPEDLRQFPRELLPELNSDASFVFGARSFRGNPAGPDLKTFNSAFLTDAQGRVLSRYHKQILLAFGEYVPFSSVLSRILGIPPMEGFTGGEGPRTLDLTGGTRIAPLICYEDLMPVLSRRFVAEKKANLLVNLTNDAWYGRTTAPWQHAWLAQWRAIETRRSLVRATNTGLTTAINARGEMVQSLPIFTPAVLRAEVEILAGETVYVRFGDWFAWAATLISFVFLLWRGRYP